MTVSEDFAAIQEDLETNKKSLAQARSALSIIPNPDSDSTILALKKAMEDAKSIYEKLPSYPSSTLHESARQLYTSANEKYLAAKKKSEDDYNLKLSEINRLIDKIKSLEAKLTESKFKKYVEDAFSLSDATDDDDITNILELLYEELKSDEIKDYILEGTELPVLKKFNDAVSAVKGVGTKINELKEPAKQTAAIVAGSVAVATITKIAKIYMVGHE